MPEKAGPVCAADGFGNADPVDELRGSWPETERVLGDDRKPEDGYSRLPVGSGKLLVADGKMPDNWPVPDERMPVGLRETPDGAII